MLGRDDDYLNGLERAHHAYLNAGEAMSAVRCAFWVGMQLSLRGEMGRATGWFGRAQRLVEREQHDCPERGYLLFPPMFQHEASGDYEAAAANAAVHKENAMKTSLTVAALCAAVLISKNARADVILDWNEITVALATWNEQALAFAEIDGIPANFNGLDQMV